MGRIGHNAQRRRRQAPSASTHTRQRLACTRRVDSDRRLPRFSSRFRPRNPVGERAKEPKRSAGLVFPCLWRRLRGRAPRFHHSFRTHVAAATICLRVLVVALVGIFRARIQAAYRQLRGLRHTARGARYRHGLALHRRRAWRMDRLDMEPPSVPRATAFPQLSARPQHEGDPQPPSCFGCKEIRSVLS